MVCSGGKEEAPTAETADGPDLYQEDVTLIMKDGAVYYLPPAEES